MGYDVHITRAENWCENEGHEISLAEWQALVDHDPELRPDPENGPCYAIWGAHPGNSDAWLRWDEGNISTKYPDEPLLAKMIQIAGALGVRVQGDEGEEYPEDKATAAAARSRELPVGPVPAFALSIIAVVGLTTAAFLESLIRRDSPLGTPMPVMYGLTFFAIGGGAAPVGYSVACSRSFRLQLDCRALSFAWAARVIDAIAFGVLRSLR